jgi:hypothetical protein
MVIVMVGFDVLVVAIYMIHIVCKDIILFVSRYKERINKKVPRARDADASRASPCPHHHVAVGCVEPTLAVHTIHVVYKER